MPNTSLTANNVFTGSQDNDTDPKYIKDGDFFDALNMRNGYGIDFGGMENVQGNVETNYHTLPTGVNKCIGTLEDKPENTMFYFIFNSLGNHQILRHYSAQNRTDIVAQGSALNFNEFHYIHSVKFVDRKYLYWTDAWEDTTILVGNEPRKLNVLKGSNFQKKFAYEFHFALDSQFTYTTLNGQTLTINGQAISFNAATSLNRNAVINHIFNTINLGAASTATTQGSTIIVTATVANTPITMTGATVANWGRLVPNNFYTTGNISETHINWAKAQPQYMPTITFISSTGSNLDRKFTQYCVRYIYDDGEKSAWGSFSICPYNTLLSGYQTLVDFYDERLNDIDWLTIIKRVEIGVRYGNTQPVKSVVVLNTSDIGFATKVNQYTTASINSNHYIHTDTFANNEVGSDDNTSDNAAQVLKYYDNIPQLTHTIEAISDENGSTMAVMMNNVRGYDNLRVNGTISFDTNVFYPPNDPLFPDILYKTHALYDWGVVYFDKYGRSSAVQKIGRFNTLRKQLMQYFVGFVINHKPPTWATTYAVVRTKDLIRDSYISYDCNAITHGAVNVDESYWQLRSNPVAPALSTSTTDITVYFDAKTREDFGFATKGDKLFAYFLSSDTKIDVPVIGYKISAAGVFSFITTKAQTLMNGATETSNNIEIYTPRTKEIDFYYEIVRLPIINNLHYGDKQVQTATLPAVVWMYGGDAKYADYDMTGGTQNIYFGALERENYYQNDLTDNEDIGRANIIDENAKREWYKSEIRFSERYNLHSQYNGLSAFRGLDYIEVADKFGSGQKLEMAKHSLLAICQHKVQPIYVNRDRMLDFQSNQSIGRTDRILNIAEEVTNNWGTRNPESVINIDGTVYAWDSYNGIFWRFAQDGQTDLSLLGQTNNFAQIGKERMSITRLTDKVITGYEKRYKTIYVTFSDIPLVRAAFTKSLEDNIRAKGWKGNMSFVPEMYGRVNDTFFSFKDGRLWLHDFTLGARCNFYGVQYNAQVIVSVNDDPSTVKTPKAFNVESTNLFVIPLIDVPVRNGYPLGQKSRILQAAKWKRQEAQWYSPVLRDYLDNALEFTNIVNPVQRETTALLRGRDLKFENMLVTLRIDNATLKTRLYRLTTQYFISENSKIY